MGATESKLEITGELEGETTSIPLLNGNVLTKEDIVTWVNNYAKRSEELIAVREELLEAKQKQLKLKEKVIDLKKQGDHLCELLVNSDNVINKLNVENRDLKNKNKDEVYERLIKEKQVAEDKHKHSNNTLRMLFDRQKTANITKKNSLDKVKELVNTLDDLDLNSNQQVVICNALMDIHNTLNTKA